MHIAEDEELPKAQIIGVTTVEATIQVVRDGKIIQEDEDE